VLARRDIVPGILLVDHFAATSAPVEIIPAYLKSPRLLGLRLLYLATRLTRENHDPLRELRMLRLERSNSCQETLGAKADILEANNKERTVIAALGTRVPTESIRVEEPVIIEVLSQ
jgi:hypothetical protein